MPCESAVAAAGNGAMFSVRKSLWREHIFDLIRRTATDLPADVERAIRRAQLREKRGGNAWWVLGEILQNVKLARRHDAPLCQDTGTLSFYFIVPPGFDTNALVGATREAIAMATRAGYLRQNAIDPVSGVPYQTNVAPGSPVFSFRQGARKTVDARLIMKGGGSENVSAQYVLPDGELGADRDLEGVRRCILDAIWQAQGQGCAPGILGVCVGGDRASGYEHAKSQFLRKLNERSPNRTLARLEASVMWDANKLGVGPMGLGGRTTVFGVHIDALSRVPATYLVTVSYMCWALRRRGMLLGPEGGLKRWLY